MRELDLKPRVAVFDSGIGGTGVFAAIRERAPWADLVYVADHAFGPYGERSLDEVRRRTELLAGYLVSAGVEMVVIACNSASAAALHHLRTVMPDTVFVGMEPAVKPAAEQTRSGVVGVMATRATFQGELFKDLVGRHGADITIVEQACPGLAAAIERGDPVGDLLDDVIPPMVDAGADVIVLGCTHYPLVIDDITRRLPTGTIVIDPAPAVARRAIDVCHEVGIDLAGSGSTWWWSTRSEIDPQGDRLWEPIDIDERVCHAVRIGQATVSAVEGDITSMRVGAIVNAANVGLAHGGGVALAIARAGGPTIDEESRDWIATYGVLEPGVAALTSAGAMPSSYVIHVAGPIYAPDQENDELLAAATFAALDMADEIETPSIALPAISAGVYGYPPDEATLVITASVAEYLSDTESLLRSVRLVGFDGVMTERFAAALRSIDLEA
jgi:glutamate racemase